MTKKIFRTTNVTRRDSVRGKFFSLRKFGCEGRLRTQYLYCKVYGPPNVLTVPIGWLLHIDIRLYS